MAKRKRKGRFPFGKTPHEILKHMGKKIIELVRDAKDLATGSDWRRLHRIESELETVAGKKKPVLKGKKTPRLTVNSFVKAGMTTAQAKKFLKELTLKVILVACLLAPGCIVRVEIESDPTDVFPVQDQGEMMNGDHPVCRYLENVLRGDGSWVRRCSITKQDCSYARAEADQIGCGDYAPKEYDLGRKAGLTGLADGTGSSRTARMGGDVGQGIDAADTVGGKTTVDLPDAPDVRVETEGPARNTGGVSGESDTHEGYPETPCPHGGPAVEPLVFGHATARLGVETVSIPLAVVVCRRASERECSRSCAFGNYSRSISGALSAMRDASRIAVPGLASAERILVPSQRHRSS